MNTDNSALKVDVDWFTKVVGWNRERGILNLAFNHVKEASFLVEEILESTGQYTSETARQRAMEIAQDLIGNETHEVEMIVDSWADVIVYATGALAKLGYNPALVMEEVFKEIDSRTGTLIEGKFVKDVNVVPYKADFNKCKL